MNYRHRGWSNGYRYYANWRARLGVYTGGLGHMVKWLSEQYGPARVYLHGPLTREQMDRYTPTLGYYPNPNWSLDTEKRRVYVTEETLMWARLLGKTD
jgi:hypothetical protein